MSKKINVNPDHYKVAGRGRQGEQVIHTTEKRALAGQRRDEQRIAPSTRRQTAGGASARTGERAMASTSAKRTGKAGISNRESPDSEARGRRQHPPISTSSPPPEDAAGRVGEHPLSDRRDRHTSHKAGSRSTAQKESGARYPDRSMPPARKVAGAFGREPQRVASVSNGAVGGIRRSRRPHAAKGKRR